jgi:molybdopterin-guanine dinucleotide biosynthesis protein A
MGRDKASLLVNGVPMAVRVAAALSAAGASAVACIGPAAGDLAAVPDLHPGEGPLGGLLTALGWAGDAVVVVAPCDLLGPDPAAFAVLAARADPVAAALVDRPLPIGLAPPAAGPLRAAFAAGERSVRRALAASDLRVTSVELRPEALADADTPADLGNLADLGRSDG